MDTIAKGSSISGCRSTTWRGRSRSMRNWATTCARRRLGGMLERQGLGSTPTWIPTPLAASAWNWSRVTESGAVVFTPPADRHSIVGGGSCTDAPAVLQWFRYSLDGLKRRLFDIAVTAAGAYSLFRSCHGQEREPAATLLRQPRDH